VTHRDGLLLAVDLGGSGLRATALDAAGRVAARGARRLVTRVDAPPLGRSWDAAELRAAAGAVIAEVVARVGPERVAAVACTGQRIACAVLDGEGGTLYIGPNTDARGLAHGWRVDDAAEGRLYERTGRGLALLYAPARLLRLRDDDPRLLEAARHVVGVGEWLAHHLCGEVALDACGAAELLALDVHTGEPWADAWERLGLDPAWIPPLRPPGTRIGEVTVEASAATGLAVGTPVALATPDSMAALIGAGCLDESASLVLAGSSMPVLAPAAGDRRDSTRRTWGTPHPCGGFVCESNAGPTGLGWAWLAERLVGGIACLAGGAADEGEAAGPAAQGTRADSAHALAERLAAQAAPGAGGAIALAGGGSILDATRPSTFLPRVRLLAWPSEVVGADLGAPEILRAGLEEVAHSARANLEQAEAARGGAGRLLLAGGMARSRLFTEILAGVCDRPVSVPAETDVTALGTAACAAVAAGWHATPAAASTALHRPGADIEPAGGRMAEVYADAHRAWRALYDQVTSL
jgi:autoinducer-2 kinase